MTLTEETAGTRSRAIGGNWLDLLREIVNVNSGFTNVAGQRRVFDILVPHFARLGFSARTIPLADERRAMTFEQPGGAPEILLVGHVDTMFQPDSPFQSLGNAGAVLTGPGISDMKAGLVLILMLLERLRDPFLLRRVRIFINDDEELGARYSRPALLRAAVGIHFALIFEPGLTDGSYVLGYPAKRRFGGGDAVRTAMRYYGREEVPLLAGHLAGMRGGLLSGRAALLPAGLQQVPDDRLAPSGRAMVVGLGPYGGKTHTTDEYLRPETFDERLVAAERICRTLLAQETAGA